MSIDIETRLRRAAFDTHAGFATEPIPPRRQPRRRTMLVLAAAAVAVITGAAVVGITLQPDDTVTVASAPTLEWKSRPGVDKGLVGMFWGGSDPLAAGGPGFVLVGLTGDEPNSTIAIAVSRDGRTWRQLGPAEVAPSRGALSEVAIGNGRFLAAGTSREPDEMLFLTSNDGVHWERCATPRFNAAPPIEVTSVAIVGSTYLALTPRGEYAAVWRSNDGCTWELVLPELGANVTGMTTSDGRAYVVAADDDDNASVLTTTDGRDWNQRSVTRETVNGSNGGMIAVFGSSVFTYSGLRLDDGDDAFHRGNGLGKPSDTVELRQTWRVGSYLFMQRYSSDPAVRPDDRPSVWVSTDGGETWSFAFYGFPSAAAGTNRAVVIMSDRETWIGTPDPT